MELKLVILSLACFSCLLPPTLGSALLAAKGVAAVGAVKGAALLGAGALAAKGLAVKGIAAAAAKGLALKGAAVKGAAALAAKGLAAKAGLALAAKEAVHSKVASLASALKPPVPVVVPETVVYSPPSLSHILNRLLAFKSTVHAAAKSKSAAASQLLLSLLPSKTVVHPPTVVEVPTIVEVPKYIMGPTKVIERPGVSVVGPSMNVVYGETKSPNFYPVSMVKKVVIKECDK